MPKRVRICLESIRSEALRREHGDTRTTYSNLYQCICLFIYIQELFQSEPLIFQTRCQKCFHGSHLAFYFLSFFLSLFHDFVLKMIFSRQIPIERGLPTHRKYFIEPLKNQWFVLGREKRWIREREWWWGKEIVGMGGAKTILERNGD